MTDIIGYGASILVAISITISGGIYFRILNMTGAICFIAYGLLIESWPITLINAYCLLINIFHIIKIIKQKRAAL